MLSVRIDLKIIFFYEIPPTLPPSTLNTDPLVAEDNGLDIYAIALATSVEEAKR